MRNIGIILAALAYAFYILSSSQIVGAIQMLPCEETKVWLKNEKSTLIKELQKLMALCEEEKPNETIQDQFIQSKGAFKKIEFLLYYLDPQLFNTSINGAPLPKLEPKVPDVTVLKPKGFQRIEELVYEDKLDFTSIKRQVKQLIHEIEGINRDQIQSQLTDAVVFEAIRMGILRIGSLGVTGFDSPVNADKSLYEANLSLEGMKIAMRPYVIYLSETEWNVTLKLIQKGQKELNSGKFETFDRSAFHRNVIRPLWNKTLVLQKSLKLELPHQRTRQPWAVNYESEAIFSDDFLIPAYYSEYSETAKDEIRKKLGEQLFYDPILSINNKMSCATCHQPEKGFADGLKTARSIVEGEFGKRNTPTIINSLYAEKFFHDLRVDRLAAQMDHVVYNPDEFNTNYSKILDKLNKSASYQKCFKEAYGTEGISKNTVTNAITTYVASLRSFNSDFDKYMRGEINEIDKRVIKGYNLFAGKAACATCHFAPTFAGLVPPNFMESESEVLGVPTNFQKPYLLDEDEGRYMNRILKEQVDFYKYSFKTPTLRNVALTAPYMHNGAFSTLEEVMDFYNQGGGIGIGLSVPHQTLPSDPLNLSKREIADIIVFMKSLTDTESFNNKPVQLPKNFGSN